MSYLRAIRIAPRIQARQLATSRTLFAGSDYGGNTAPAGQRPSDQKNKPNPSEGLEHPGPKSPAEGRSSSGSSGSSKPSPKIHQDQQSLSDEHSDEAVRKHNEEAQKRHDRSDNSKDEKVDKGYWKQAGHH